MFNFTGSITVGQRSCLGCYTCRQISGTSLSCASTLCLYSTYAKSFYLFFNITIIGTTSIGNDSCLHSNACEKSSGTRSIADYACQGFKACQSIVVPCVLVELEKILISQLPTLHLHRLKLFRHGNHQQWYMQLQQGVYVSVRILRHNSFANLFAVIEICGAYTT